MPLIEYVPRQFSPDNKALIRRANEICADYAAQGFDLTLRQLYYQFVSRGWIPNTQRDYKRLGSIISDARLAGVMDWHHIIDRTRHLRGLAHWESPREIVDAIAYQFRTDCWADQPTRPEVWIEKDALAGVIERVCNGLDVPYFSCRGYTSSSELWSAAQRLRGYGMAGQQPVVIHLGDHDPSGLDMTRDIRDRLALFGADVEVRRIALTMEQVEHYAPPPNPAKITDSRASGYIRRFGTSSWELDALDPATLSTLIEEEVSQWRDERLWSAAVERMEQQKALLRMVSRRWDEVQALVGDE
ncbi:hypothetical protein [Actinomadura litoris]|uniref:hypothetical protein n=1 Tax=Actinomadura litoris TaxID=2678616 RepID=UPI001FA7A986|nr:hypothetical protein [Actinomadura litoris]